MREHAKIGTPIRSVGTDELESPQIYDGKTPEFGLDLSKLSRNRSDIACAF